MFPFPFRESCHILKDYEKYSYEQMKNTKMEKSEGEQRKNNVNHKNGKMIKFPNMKDESGEKHENLFRSGDFQGLKTFLFPVGMRRLVVISRILN